ncbi:uncharacterized protein PV07_12284 [Cladophialophora immunda]|uniref:DUF1993 domain-containing protein n=1 Tax=Cladophialophora immunda TaxID=569365 RepID=A0A0D2BVE7_9EURO|nr:uncharacterized protein PV07_12284 [Cladophialophora immunda]KIW22395.1 hypothetical protein PV07_12284 [Cladophialophora immunda]
MASLNLYDTTIVPIVRTLRNLSSLLKKGENFADAKGIPHSELLEARIAPDMAALPFQVQTCSNTAKFLAVRVAGVENVPWEDNEKTFDELQARITKTIDFLEAVKREDFEGKEADHEITFQGVKLTGLVYVNAFAMPNFYFHAVTAYDLLRMKGVDIGKKDWLGRN